MTEQTEFVHLQGTEWDNLADRYSNEWWREANTSPSDWKGRALLRTLTALNDALGENKKLRTALEWYLDDDRRSVFDGILEKVEDRPAYEALEADDDRA